MEDLDSSLPLGHTDTDTDTDTAPPADPPAPPLNAAAATLPTPLPLETPPSPPYSTLNSSSSSASSVASLHRDRDRDRPTTPQLAPPPQPTKTVDPQEEARAAEVAALRTENARLRDLLDRHCEYTCRGGAAPPFSSPALSTVSGTTTSASEGGGGGSSSIPTHSPPICRFLAPPGDQPILNQSLQSSIQALASPARRHRKSSMSGSSLHRPADITPELDYRSPSQSREGEAPEVKIQELERSNVLLLDRAKEAEQKAEDMKRESDAKSLFIATVSHELRTPLNGILGMVSSLLHAAEEAVTTPTDDLSSPTQPQPQPHVLEHTHPVAATSSPLVYTAVSPPPVPFLSPPNAPSSQFIGKWSSSSRLSGSSSVGRDRMASTGSMSSSGRISTTSSKRAGEKESNSLSLEQLENVQIIKDCADELLRTVDDVLLFSKSQAGMLTLTEHPFHPLLDVIHPSLRLLELRAWTKGVELLCDSTLDPRMKLHGDASKIRTCVTNLVANAVKFTERGYVKVVLSGREIEREQESEGVKRKGFELKVAVEDTGIGIPEDRRHLIFKSFSQVDGKFRPRYEGTGLGLSIVRTLVELMSGTVDFTSSFGHGSCFFFTLPLGISEQIYSQEEEEEALGSSTSIEESVGSSTVTSASTTHQPRGRSLESSTPRATILDSMFDDPLSHTRTSSEQPTTTTSSSTLFPPLSTTDLPDPFTTTARSSTDLSQLTDYDALSSSGSLSVSSSSWDTLQDSLGTQQSIDNTERRTSDSSERAALASQIQSKIRERLSSPSVSTSGKEKGEGTRVLVAEDNLVGAKVVQKFLKRLGYADVYFAMDGIQAYEAVVRAVKQDKRPFHIVLMDMSMPRANGIESTKLIESADLDNLQPWIIALTANALPSDRDQCLSAGMHEYLSKPVDLEGLRKVMEMFRERRLPRLEVKEGV